MTVTAKNVINWIYDNPDEFEKAVIHMMKKMDVNKDRTDEELAFGASQISNHIRSTMGVMNNHDELAKCINAYLCEK